MIYVGIDIAKLNHFAAIFSDGEILIEPFKFTNDADGFQLLIRLIWPICTKWTHTDTLPMSRQKN